MTVPPHPTGAATSLQTPVRFRDCDPLGHVNNAVYLTYFEMVRGEFWQKVMQPGRSLEWPFILAEATVSFRAPAKAGDVLAIELVVDAIGTRSWGFRYRILNAASGSEIAVGLTVQVAYDYHAGRSIAIPPEIRAKLEQYLAPAAPASSP